MVDSGSKRVDAIIRCIRRGPLVIVVIDEYCAPSGRRSRIDIAPPVAGEKAPPQIDVPILSGLSQQSRLWLPASTRICTVMETSVKIVHG
jgi:hypothetical protein